ncbi:MAG: hypothetical protein KIC78_03105, partial [Prevotella sp.]|uniref:hypothetical protein n=1 Tax=Prevotella sp. TaxID=59823 RepID=UPI00257D3314
QQTKEKTGVFNPKRMLFKQNTINLHLLLEFALENLWIQPIIFVKNVSIDMRIMALFVYL